MLVSTVNVAWAESSLPRSQVSDRRSCSGRVGEVRLAWHAKETLRGLYDINCPQLAERYATELADDLADADCPPELRRLGRTLARWQVAIVNWHHARVTNEPTEAINNLIKRVKRAAFGFRRFAHYRIRALLYAGKPNWTLLAGLTPR